MNIKFRFSIDRGGTFTDIFCEVVEYDHLGEVRNIKPIVMKLLSEDPSNYKDAPTEGIRRILMKETGKPFPKDKPVDSSQIEFIRMGTTVATNALLERKGERIALITTKGFGDLQVIGNQSRPKIFDLEIKRPDILFEEVHEIDERVILERQNELIYHNYAQKIGKSNESLIIEKTLDEKEVELVLKGIFDRGIKSLAVVFIHSFTFPDHELAVKKIASRLGFEQISLSSEIMPMIRAVPRGGTTCVDAYLTPVIKAYLKSFSLGFDEGLANCNISFMQSDGGLTPMSEFSGNKAILSGPAGGVVGYAITSQLNHDLDIELNPSKCDDIVDTKGSLNVIGFDMGGTSTDVSRFAGEYEHVFETTTAGVTIQSPQLDINTVAAGGGSRLFYRNGVFVVGPESSGAHPGPICYRKGGFLSVTDANVFLGRIQPHLFPSIFGETEDLPLDIESTKTAFIELTKLINSSSDAINYTPDEVAYGFIRVANEAMARPIRNLTTMKGYDVTKHVLACFGGAGPQHCCAIAKSLGMNKVFVNRYSGILSAFGLSRADVVVEKQEPFNSSTIDESLSLAMSKLDHLEQLAVKELEAQGFQQSSIHVIRFLNCRYQGTDTANMTSVEKSASLDDCKNSFVDNYKREYGFELKNRAILIDDVRVRAIGKSSSSSEYEFSNLMKKTPIASPPEPTEFVEVYFEGQRHTTPVFKIENLKFGHKVEGPALIIQNVATVVIEPNCCCFITASEDIEIFIEQKENKSIGIDVDPIYLSIFSHRFMGIAEQMGRTLQRTSISVNIKERLDFSCALFDQSGGLVANAPHLPVHLGAMSEAVKHQIKYWKDDLVEGDVLVSNHPQLAGGSHLPDITVITPIFNDGNIAFFVASRGHHSDIGGIAPGSMPPLSKTLTEEGAAIVAFKLVKNGNFQEDGITDLLMAPGKFPGNSGARNISDNLSDLRAQVAANQKGAFLMHDLVSEYGLDVVQAYMKHIQDSAEQSVRAMLKEFSVKENLPEIGVVSATDYMDDGSPIELKITIDRKDGSALFDFEGTAFEMYGNLNAPPAVASSAIIYCLRCLLSDVDIPLNQGCLNPVTIKIPQNSLLNPSSNAAVVGGNVLTSQRVTDVVLKAFHACAASQGCMNNFTFGDDSMGYYETIAGGAGAGPGWDGCSAVHTHMTNTRITDPEIFEKRYPVILRQFSIRKNSGGLGEYIGGDGVIREIEFRKPLVASILSERRSFQPYGMNEGCPGSRGLNTLYFFNDHRIVNLGGKNTIQVNAGDRILIQTPGGGGYGNKSHRTTHPIPNPSTNRLSLTGGSLNQFKMKQESI